MRLSAFTVRKIESLYHNVAGRDCKVIAIKYARAVLMASYVWSQIMFLEECKRRKVTPHGIRITVHGGVWECRKVRNSLTRFEHDVLRKTIRYQRKRLALINLDTSSYGDVCKEFGDHTFEELKIIADDP